ncbi:MAG: hypothetical protein JKY31_09395 [Rhodobacteraceae bacterium]|nr:hypothetical protein [Paracoccaceae bacterium]
MENALLVLPRIGANITQTENDIAPEQDQTEAVQNAPITALAIIDLPIEKTATEPNAEMLARLAEAQEQLLLQLARAADQGLIEFVPPKHAPPEEIVIELEMVDDEPAQTVVDPSILRQLSARTAYDAVAESDLASIINEFAMPQCMDNFEFDMTDWSNDQGFSAQVSSLRANMFGEFDIMVEAEAIALAKLYITYGFSAEAETVLAGLPEGAEIVPLLVDFARVIDGDSWQIDGPLSLGVGCGGHHEMWFLAGATEPQTIVDPQFIIDAFSGYPIETRLLIGPNLVDILRISDQLETAQIILDIIHRAEPIESSAVDLANAMILETRENIAEASGLFEEIADGYNESSSEALIGLVRTTLDFNLGVTEVMLTDLSAAAFAQHGTDIGNELRLWEIRVSGQINGLMTALEMIDADRRDEMLGRDDLQNLAIEILGEYSAQEQGNLSYAEAVLTYQNLLGSAVNADSARIHMASELLGLGLPGAALDVLAPTIYRGSAAANLVAAQSYVAEFEPEKALEILTGDSSDAATELVLSALLLKNDHTSIREILNNPVNSRFVQNSLAWRVGNWENIQGNGRDVTLAAYMMGERGLPAEADFPDILAGSAFLLESVVPEVPNLQAARTLLEVNRASRLFIESALNNE